MKINHHISLCVLLALGAGLAGSAQAAGAVGVTQSKTGSIELTNLDEASDKPDGPAAVAPGKTTVHALRPPAAAQSAASGKPKPALHKKKNADGTDAEEDRDSEADVAAQDEQARSGESADAAPVDAMPSAATAQGEQGTDGATAYGSFNYSGGASAGGANLATPGTGSGSSASANTGTAGSATATSTSSGTGSSNQAPTAGTGMAGADGQSGVDAQLAAQLAQYRALMLQQATYSNLSNVNPALSRRYLAVDRATYQARIGN